MRAILWSECLRLFAEITDKWNLSPLNSCMLDPINVELKYVVDLFWWLGDGFCLFDIDQQFPENNGVSSEVTQAPHHHSNRATGAAPVSGLFGNLDHHWKVNLIGWNKKSSKDGLTCIQPKSQPWRVLLKSDLFRGRQVTPQQRGTNISLPQCWLTLVSQKCDISFPQCWLTLASQKGDMFRPRPSPQCRLYCHKRLSCRSFTADTKVTYSSSSVDWL